MARGVRRRPCQERSVKSPTAGDDDYVTEVERQDSIGRSQTELGNGVREENTSAQDNVFRHLQDHYKQQEQG